MRLRPTGATGRLSWGFDVAVRSGDGVQDGHGEGTTVSWVPGSDRSLTFVTGNAGKFATASEHLAAVGVEVGQVSLDLDEIQSTDVAIVAKHKAGQAFRALRSPLFVHDSGFGFDALDGWLGPMVRQLVEAVGARGIAHIADLTSNRRCGFVSSPVYVHGDGELTAFEDGGVRGTVATVPTRNVPEAWSGLWQVFVPEGTSRPLASLDGDERRGLLAAWRERSAFTRFARWFAGQQGASECGRRGPGA